MTSLRGNVSPFLSQTKFEEGDKGNVTTKVKHNYFTTKH